jgi:hypothetical protein
MTKYFNIRVIIALTILVAMLYFAIGAVAQHKYSGSELNFATSGIVSLDSDAAANVTATSNRSFTISTDNPEMRTLRAEREGSGRSAVYGVQADLLSGANELRVTRGSDVNFVITADSPIRATVAARSAEGNRNVVIATVVVSLALLFYISQTTGHAGLKMIQQRISPKTPAVGEVGAASA